MSTLDQAAIQAKARKFHLAHSGIKSEFDRMVSEQIALINLFPATVLRCPSCEHRACDLCGKCHATDKWISFVGEQCPLQVEQEDQACTAWVWAYHYLKSAFNQLDGRNALGEKVAAP